MGPVGRPASSASNGRERDARQNGVPLRGATVAGLRDLGELAGLADEVEALLAGG